MARFNATITVAAGTPFNLFAAMTSAQMITAGFTAIPPKPLNEISIQMLPGGTGLGYVMNARGQTSATQQWRVPASSGIDLVATLAPASATAPGSQYADKYEAHSINLSEIWVDGSHTGDTIQVSYDTKA